MTVKVVCEQGILKGKDTLTVRHTRTVLSGQLYQCGVGDWLVTNILYIRYKEAFTRLTDHNIIRKVILPDKNIIFSLLR